MDDSAATGGLIIPVCKDELRPYLGQKFNSLQEAIAFYEEYARDACFDSRKGGHKSIGGVTIWQYLVCTREGVHRYEDDVLGNAQDGPLNKRRRPSKRCGCKAKIVFRFISEFGMTHYVVQKFIEKHNHAMVEKQHKHFLKGNRKLNEAHLKFVEECTRANISPTSTFNLLKEFFGGYETVGCTLSDVRNCSRDIKEKVKGADVQMILNQMQEKKELCDGFFYKFRLDSEGKLISLFWSDSESRRHYHMFGDVVSFDTTYSTNRYCMVFGPFTGKDNHGCPVAFGAGFVCSENADSFSWLFTVFVECMSSAPKLLITDQDLGMKLAIESVLVGTRHRWCMWHIMSKLFDKVPKSVLEIEEFKKDLKFCVWSELLEPHEFEYMWEAIMQQYGLEDVSWFTTMFVNRRFWIPAYFRDFPMSSLMKTTSLSECENIFFKSYTTPHFNLVDFTLQYNHALDAQRNQTERLDYNDSTAVPMLLTDFEFENHAASLYTDKMFRIVQDEIMEAVRRCRMTDIFTDVNMKIFTVVDGRHNTCYVKHEIGTESYECDCKLYGRKGILCCHIFCVFRNSDVKIIPERYICPRWLKKPLLKAVHGDSSNEPAFHQDSTVDDEQRQRNKSHMIYFRLFHLSEGKVDGFKALVNALEKVEEQLFGDCSSSLPLVVNPSRVEIENIYGAARPDVITAHPPNMVSTKGSRKRLKSNKEKAIRQSSKRPRRCGTCQELGDHNSRTCGRLTENLNEK